MDPSILGGVSTFLSLLLAVVLGALLGTERTLAHKVAGMRTFSLVALGSAAFVIIGNLQMEQALDPSSIDSLRIASQIILGIGFLGSGLIIVQDKTVNGLTTAAGMWVVAAIGMACGFGLYYLALFITALTLFIFRVLFVFEEKLNKTVGD